MKIASCWFAETSSAGRFISAMLEMVMAHLKVGAQKNIVNGPAGCAKREEIGEGHGSLSTAAWIRGTIAI